MLFMLLRHRVFCKKKPKIIRTFCEKGLRGVNVSNEKRLFCLNRCSELWVTLFNFINAIGIYLSFPFLFSVHSQMCILKYKENPTTKYTKPIFVLAKREIFIFSFDKKISIIVIIIDDNNVMLENEPSIFWL